MNRWKVNRVRLRTGGWGEWEACNDGAPWMYFRTHAEALAFADQRARTIQVTLPPMVKHPSNDVPDPAWHMPGEFIRHWISTAHGKVWMTDHRGLGDLMDADVAERRGLALIAAAKHAKGELA